MECSCEYWIFDYDKQTFFLDFRLGAGSYFSYKTTGYNRILPTISSQEYYENIKKINPDSSIKSVEYRDEKTIVFKYKYFGIMNSTVFPNFGIHIGLFF